MKESKFDVGGKSGSRLLVAIHNTVQSRHGGGGFIIIFYVTEFLPLYTVLSIGR